MEIKKHLSDIIRREVDNPHIEMVTITRVDTRPDLRESKVYFSVFNEDTADEIIKVLNTMASFIRRELGKRMKIKILPHLTFFYDDFIKYSVDIYNKIEEIKDAEEDY